MSNKRIIRVFPRRTSHTPSDNLVFIGDPSLFRPPADEVHISVTFTWDIEEGYRLQKAWNEHYDQVNIGGPAIKWSNQIGEFTPGMYTKQGITITSRGCNRNCPWCLVPFREGKLRLLDIRPGHIIQDNNILSTPQSHQSRVYEMLRKQKQGAIFSGGIDAGLVDNWFVGQVKEMRINSLFLAADTRSALKPLIAAADKLQFLGREKLRCYVLIAFAGESLAEAEMRLMDVWQAGCMPFAQLYQPPERRISYSREWRDLTRTWSRPAAMKTLMRNRIVFASSGKRD